MEGLQLKPRVKSHAVPRGDHLFALKLFLALDSSDSFLGGLAASFGFCCLRWYMNIDVRSEHDLDRYDQVFNNPVLDTLFGVDNGNALFLQFSDCHTIHCIRSACFATLLEVRDFGTAQDACEGSGPSLGLVHSDTC